MSGLADCFSYSACQVGLDYELVGKELKRGKNYKISDQLTHQKGTR